jgi:ribonucleoside-diphosphate reductase subunit M1
MERSIINRSGVKQPLDVSKIQQRITSCADQLDLDIADIIIATVNGCKSTVTTQELDNISIEAAQHRQIYNINNDVLASRILISGHIKNNLAMLRSKFNLSDGEIKKRNLELTYRLLYICDQPQIHPLVMKFIMQYSMELEQMIDYDREYNYTTTAYQTNMLQYLLKVNKQPIEKVQHLYMRISISLCVLGEYYNVNVDRTDWIALLNEANKLLVTVFADRHEKIIGKFRSGKINFDDLVFLIKSMGHIDLANEFVQIYNKHTKSWQKYLESLSDFKSVDLAKVKNIYDMLSLKYYSHASPTMFNLGTLYNQASSCYILGPNIDSVYGINKNYMYQSMLSKHAGGIGSVPNIRAINSKIKSSGGAANGILVPMKIADELSSYINQSDKRDGAHAITPRLYHPEIMQLLDARHPLYNGNNKIECLQVCAWICDEFMRTVRKEITMLKQGIAKPQEWYLISPDVSGDLMFLYDHEFVINPIDDNELDKHDLKFTKEYRRLVKLGLYKHKVSALELFDYMLKLIQEMATPYMMNSDAINRKNPTRKMIYSSNLCCEITLHANPIEIAVCNLSNTVLSSFICDQKQYEFSMGYETNILCLIGKSTDSKIKYFDYNKLAKVVEMQVINLNHIIDSNYYPVNNAKYSNMKYRPIAIGVQDLQGLLFKLLLPYASDAALELQFRIKEFTSFVATKTSIKLAKQYFETYGKPGWFDGYEQSNYKIGKFQWQLWLDEHKAKDFSCIGIKHKLIMDWDSLRDDLAKYGIRNSNLEADMPTSSVSKRCSDYTGEKIPSTEPATSFISKSKNKIGEKVVINHYLFNTLKQLDLSIADVYETIMNDRLGGIGSLNVPTIVKQIYRTCWQISLEEQFAVYIHSAVFIDQSKSNNIFLYDTNRQELSKYYMQAWLKGAKTLSYYARSRAKVDAMKICIKREDGSYSCCE